MLTVTIEVAPFFGPALSRASGREQRREIAHVGHGGLDHDGEADAVLPAGLARGVAAPLQIFEPAVADRDLDRARIIAGIVERAGRRAIREFIRRHEIAPDHVEMVEPELDRDALHQPLQRQIELRTAEAADQARRHLVGQHHAVDRRRCWRCRSRRSPRRACGRAARASARAGTRRSPRAGRASARGSGRPWSTAASISVTRFGPELAATDARRGPRPISPAGR